jgi:hypothetical protein
MCEVIEIIGLIVDILWSDKKTTWIKCVVLLVITGCFIYLTLSLISNSR